MVNIQVEAGKYATLDDEVNKLSEQINKLEDEKSAIAQSIREAALKLNNGAHAKFEFGGQMFTVAFRNESYYIKRASR